MMSASRPVKPGCALDLQGASVLGDGLGPASGQPPQVGEQHVAAAGAEGVAELVGHRHRLLDQGFGAGPALGRELDLAEVAQCGGLAGPVSDRAEAGQAVPPVPAGRGEVPVGEVLPGQRFVRPGGAAGVAELPIPPQRLLEPREGTGGVDGASSRTRMRPVPPPGPSIEARSAGAQGSASTRSSRSRLALTDGHEALKK